MASTVLTVYVAAFRNQHKLRSPFSPLKMPGGVQLVTKKCRLRKQKAMKKKPEKNIQKVKS
jgi:hypothetical protein